MAHPKLSTKLLIKIAKARCRLRKKKREAKQSDDRSKQFKGVEAAFLSALRKHSQDIATTHTQHEVTASSFPKFAELPAELRRIIWKMALPERRIFEPRIRQSENSIEPQAMYLRHGHPPPALRAACKEAWMITEENGFFCFGYKEQSGSNGFWFNPSVDMVYFSRSDREEQYYDRRRIFDLEDDMDLYFDWIGTNEILHVAFQWEVLMRHSQVVFSLPSAESITATYETTHLSKASNRMGPLAFGAMDEDNFCGVTPMRWVEYKKDILMQWMNGMTPSQRLPRLEGAEIIRPKPKQETKIWR